MVLFQLQAVILILQFSMDVLEDLNMDCFIYFSFIFSKHLIVWAMNMSREASCTAMYHNLLYLIIDLIQGNNISVRHGTNQISKIEFQREACQSGKHAYWHGAEVVLQLLFVYEPSHGNRIGGVCLEGRMEGKRTIDLFLLSLSKYPHPSCSWYTFSNHSTTSLAC